MFAAAARNHPLLVVLAAGAVGAVGGLLLGRASRLVFCGAVGYVLNELWRGDGRIELLGRIRAQASPRTTE
jgi:hypothetical protein